MSDTVLQQILDRIRTVDQRLDMISQHLSLHERTLSSRLQALEANQGSLLRHCQASSVRGQSHELEALLNISIQQRINDLSARITRLEFKSSSRSNPT